jgi:hypothetical protein
MKLDLNGLLSSIAAPVLIALAISSSAHAQGTVNIKFYGPGHVEIPAPAVQYAPSSSIYVEAQPTNPTGVAKVTIYRNDVPFQTVSSTPYSVEQINLGQETYHFYARVLYNNGEYIDSPEIKLMVYSPNVYKMGTPIGPYSTPGPGRNIDHTTVIQNVVNWISNPDGNPNTDDGGGTLFFPCNVPVGDGISRYNIKDTIIIPKNVTLQGESSEYGGGCQIVWRDVAYNPPFYWINDDEEQGPDQARNCTDNSTHSPDPGGLETEPMFKIVGDNSRRRRHFRRYNRECHDLGLYGWNKSSLHRQRKDLRYQAAKRCAANKSSPDAN